MKLFKVLSTVILGVMCLISQQNISGMIHHPQQNQSCAKFLFGIDDDVAFKVATGFEPEKLDGLSQSIIEKTRILFLKNHLFLFDGVDGATQCHIGALMVVRLSRNKPFLEWLDSTKNILDLINKNNAFKQDLRFLALCLLLSNVTLGGNRGKLLDTIFQIKPTGSVTNALKSGKSSLMLRTKKQLLDEKTLFFNSFLNGNTTKIQWQEFAITTDGVDSVLPKIVGISCMLDSLEFHHDLWTIIKCKLGDTKQAIIIAISPDQHTITDKLDGIGINEPVIVIEACSSIKQEKEFKEWIFKFDPKQLQLAMASIFMLHRQPAFITNRCVITFFNETIKKFASMALEKNITTDEQQSFFCITHMTPGTLREALERPLDTIKTQEIAQAIVGEALKDVL